MPHACAASKIACSQCRPTAVSGRCAELAWWWSRSMGLAARTKVEVGSTSGRHRKFPYIPAAVFTADLAIRPRGTRTAHGVLGPHGGIRPLPACAHGSASISCEVIGIIHLVLPHAYAAAVQLMGRQETHQLVYEHSQCTVCIAHMSHTMLSQHSHSMLPGLCFRTVWGTLRHVGDGC